MRRKPKCGLCNKYAKTVIIDRETNEVEFVCKKHGVINQYIIFEQC